MKNTVLFVLISTCIIYASCMLSETGKDKDSPPKDENPVYEIKNITCTLTAPGEILITWDFDNSDDVEYCIERKSSPFCDYTLITWSEYTEIARVENKEYTDANLNLQYFYYYRIRLYINGQYSEYFENFSSLINTECIGYLEYSNAIPNSQFEISKMNFSPEGKHLYVFTLNSNKIYIYERNADTGNLTLLSTIVDGENGVDGLQYMKQIIISPDGKNAYTTADGDHAVSVFNRDASSGLLTYLTSIKNDVYAELTCPTNICISNDGKNAYVLGYSNSSVITFNRDTFNGSLTYVGYINGNNLELRGLCQPTNIAIANDGLSLYIAGERGIVEFLRDANTGILTFSKGYDDINTNDDELWYGQDIKITNDGSLVFYTTAGFYGLMYENPLAVFERDISSGIFSYVTPFDEKGGQYAMMDISCDDNNLYIADYDNNVITYVIDKTGPWKAPHYFGYGNAGIRGYYVICSPDGKHVYVISYGQIIIYNRYIE